MKVTTAAQPDSPGNNTVTGAGGQIGGIQSAYSSRSVLFPVRISVPMEWVFKGEEAEIQKLTGVRAQHRETAGGRGACGRNQAPSRGR